MTYYRSESNDPAFVYIVETALAFKLGYSKDPHARVAFFQVGNHLPINLTAVFAVTHRSVEGETHKRFRKHGYGNEWYPLTAKSALIDFVVSLGGIEVPLEYIPEKEHSSRTESFRRSPPHCLDAGGKWLFLLGCSQFQPFLIKGNWWHCKSDELLALTSISKRVSFQRQINLSARISRYGKIDGIDYLGQLFKFSQGEYSLSKCKQIRIGDVAARAYQVI